ncbi:MAG TPA: SGNH/GDSL hydrolase family protein [Gemmatimonadaceae bacterium]|jgi:lysophospholipase L1-like esterase|nr:SGNH/GDSL hydrolase family protein [Gemmatimonadaceae bacterium]
MIWKAGTIAAAALSIAAAAGAQGSREGALRFLALGDSYTIGESVDSAGRWPVQLARALRAKKINVSDPEIVARTGWTTDELAAGIQVAAPGGPYDLVSLLIGVNNQYRGRDAEKYRAEFKSLLAQSVEFAAGKASRVIVLSIPDWGVTPFAAGRDRAKIGADIDKFNSIAREETLAAGAHWVDVTPVSREPHDGWYAGDGLHPTAAQYARWAALALDAATAALKK